MFEVYGMAVDSGFISDAVAVRASNLLPLPLPTLPLIGAGARYGDGGGGC